jgi:hypothetical protein
LSVKCFPHPAFRLLLLFLAGPLAAEPQSQPPAPMQAEFEKLNADPSWKPALEDAGTADWFLDGELAKVKATPEGLELHAGEKGGDNAGHMVLWTKAEFSGDLRVSYRFTRLDEVNQYVNILYLYATGTGETDAPVDIAAWADQRKVALMKTYYERMRLLHISYAAYGKGQEYIRARRYPTAERDNFPRFDTETVIPPDYAPGGLFQPGVEHRITVIRAGKNLFFHVTNGTEERLCHWDLGNLEPLDRGRIGLRLMAGRASRVAEFTVSTRPSE